MPRVHESESLSPTALRVLTALKAQSSLSASILRKQCELSGLDPAQLKETDLAVLVPRLVSALGRFVAPEKVELFRRVFARWDSLPARQTSTESMVCEVFLRRPPLQGLAAQLLEIITLATPLATPLLKAQCAKANVDVTDLKRTDLPRLIPALVAAIERFGSTEGAAQVRRRLLRLIDES